MADASGHRSQIIFGVHQNIGTSLPWNGNWYMCTVAVKPVLECCIVSLWHKSKMNTQQTQRSFEQVQNGILSSAIEKRLQVDWESLLKSPSANAAWKQLLLVLIKEQISQNVGDAATDAENSCGKCSTSKGIPTINELSVCLRVEGPCLSDLSISRSRMEQKGDTALTQTCSSDRVSQKMAVTQVSSTKGNWTVGHLDTSCGLINLSCLTEIIWCWNTQSHPKFWCVYLQHMTYSRGLCWCLVAVCLRHVVFVSFFIFLLSVKFQMFM